jgi:hypothetical protein
VISPLQRPIPTKDNTIHKHAHRNTKANIHASSGIRAYDPSKQAAKSYALFTLFRNPFVRAITRLSGIDGVIKSLAVIITLRNPIIKKHNPLTMTTIIITLVITKYTSSSSI